MAKSGEKNNEPDEPLIPDGMVVEICGRRLHVRISGKTAILHDVKTHEERESDVEEISEMLSMNAMSIEPTRISAANSVPAHFDPNNSYQIDDIPETLRSEAAAHVWVEKIKWLNRLKRKGYTSLQDNEDLELTLREIEHETVQKCPFKPSTLYKASRELKRSEHGYKAIFPQFALRGGKGQSRLPEPIEAVISEVLHNAEDAAFGLLQASRIHEAVVGKVSQLRRADPNTIYATPSLPTVTRRLNEHFTAFEIFARKYGVERAKKKFRTNGSRVTADRALDVVEFDDKDTDCFLIDERTYLPWGRAYVTAGVDQATYSVLGLSISEHTRSIQSAWAAFEHAVYPKDMGHPDFVECIHPWEAYGHIGTAFFDNATYNAALDLQASVLEYGAEVGFAEPMKPTNKSCIEHFNDVLIRNFVCHLPGWSGEKEDREALNNGIGNAVYTLGEFRRELMAWITDIYSNSTIGSTGKSPREAWKGAFQFGGPLLPRRIPPLTLAGTVRQTLKKRDSGGLLRKQLRYQSPELHELMKGIGSKFDYVLRYKPYDLSHLMVQNPRTNAYLRVPCVEDPRKYEYISDYQQSLILKYRAKSKKNGAKPIDLFEARQRLIDNTRQLAASNSMQKRKAARRTGQIPEVEEFMERTKKPQLPPKSKVEKFVNEIDEYELEEEDYEVEFYK